MLSERPKELFLLPSIVSDDATESLVRVLLSIFICYCAGEAFGTWRVVRKQGSHPLVGSRVSFFPAFLLNLVFATSAAQLLKSGYEKFKTSTFLIIRNDGPVLVLPQHLLEELSSLPTTVASPQGALEHDLLGRFTGLNLILESRLHHLIVQRRLTPRLPQLLPHLEAATKAAFTDHFPDSEDWSEILPYQVLGRVSARVSAEAIVGPAFCDNKTWLGISFEYTESLFRTVVVLRALPDWMKGIVAVLLPSYWSGRRYIQLAKHLLAPEIQELMDKYDNGSWQPEDDLTDNLNIMGWLSAMAKGRDRNAESIAHVQVLVALASVHTTLLRMVNVLYDITAAEDELRNELMEEIGQVAAQNGGQGWQPDCVNTKARTPYDALDRLDSVIRESQRLSPPTTLGLKRIFKVPYTFKDGTHVASGTYVCLPIAAIENDAMNTESPEKYDGLRSFRAREIARNDDNEHEAKQHLFTTPTPTVLNFGYGKSACPGRFFAAVVVKMVVVKLLTDYEFEFLPGTGRPRNLMAHEFLFTWPWQKMRARRRKVSKCPF